MCIKGKLVFYIGGEITNDRTRPIGIPSNISGDYLTSSNMMNPSNYGGSALNSNKDYPNRHKKYIFKVGD